MENLIQPDNWFDTVDYYEEIKSLTQEIQGFSARIYANSEGKEDTINQHELDEIVKKVLESRNDLMSNKVVFKTEDEAIKYTEKLNKLWHYFDKIENNLLKLKEK